MVAPISTLSNMEMQLYGGKNFGTSAPSYMNGYQASSTMMNPYAMMNQYSTPMFNGYSNYPNNYNNASFGQTIPQNYATNLNQYSQNTQVNNTDSTKTKNAQPTTIFQGLTQAEQKALVNTYRKGLEPPEQLALASGVGMQALMMNPRVIAHPKNTIKAFFSLKGAGDTNKMFDAVKKGGKLTDLWKENAYIMEEAFAQMNRTECRSMGKRGWFRKQYTADEYKKLKGIMQKAIDSGNIDEVAKATETLRHAQSSNGKIPAFWDKIRGKDSSTVASRLADSDVITKNTSELLKHAKATSPQGMTYTQAWNRVGGKWGLVFGAVEILGSVGQIKTAFEEDTTTGFKQLGQSIVKAGASALGWQAGEALGVWGASKLTPMIAKRFGGKWATVIGALARPVCALAANWLSRKTAKAIVGEDVANKIQANQAAATNDGQQMIVQNIVERMQAGEKVDLQTQQALQKLKTMYA